MPDDAPEEQPPGDPPRPRGEARRPDDRADRRRQWDDRDDDDARRRRRDDHDDDDYDDRPRRRRRREDEGDQTGGLIPYKNAMALTAYYCGVFSLIPCAGAILGPIAVVFGFLGLSHAKRFPASRGQAHAWVGIVIGVLTTLLNIGGPIALVAYGALSKK